MNKMTPMILVMLMLTSVLASIDFVELQEMKEIEDTSARASGDPEVVVITSPRETTCDMSGDCLDELLAGDPVNFRAYLRNSGDADLDNMQYTVEIRTNDNGNRGDIVTDVSGNELSWTNSNAVCNTSPSCQQTVLTQGAFLTGGEALLKDSLGATLSWTPSSGSYFVVISVSSNVLGDPGNNELSVAVQVRDYFDVEVDLTWLDGSGAPVSGSVDGSGAKDFQVSVSLTSPGNPSMTIRNASVSMTYTNLGSGDASSFTVGHSSTVNIRETTGSGTPAQTGTRLIVGSNGLNGSHVGVAAGSVTPSSVSGEYSVSAVLSEYTVYGPHGQSICGGSALDTIYCEKTVTSQDWADEYSGSNEATIYGSLDVFQDITLTQFQIWKGLDGEDPEVFGSLGLDITSSLSPGDYDLYAEVGHVSSSSSILYNWSVDFTITDSEGTSTVVTANSCDSKVDYDNSQLGAPSIKTPDAQMLVYACASVSMTEGEFEVEAEANLLGQWDEDGLTLDDKIDDMSLSNNKYSFDVEVTNFAPQILSLSLVPDSVTADSDKTSFTATASVFDVEGDQIDYVWTDTAGDEINCAGSSPDQCTVSVDESMVPTYRINLAVYDSYGASDNTNGEITVLNYDSFTSPAENTLHAEYEITYKSTGLGITFANASDVTDVELPGYDGTYSSVGGMTISPSTTYDTKDIMSQTITVAFDNQVDATSMWLKVGNIWQLLATGTPDEFNATSSSYSYTWGAGESMFTANTEFYLFGGVLSQAQAPSANISGFTAVPSIAGGISINWAIDGTMLSEDEVVVTICDTDPQCANAYESSWNSDVSSMLYSGQNTVHGNTYYVTAAVCKGDLCSNEATATVVADKEVASVTAVDVTISESGETWVVNWNASAEDSDVASWLVCYLKASFTASEMSDLVGTNACVSTDSTTATIDKYSTAGTYNVHFAIAPVDVVGNIAPTASSDNIEYSRADDNTNPDDGSQTTETEASSGVPTWTWGVIGIVVVVAFVAGAFILSRGDDGEDEGKDWDY